MCEAGQENDVGSAQWWTEAERRELCTADGAAPRVAFGEDGIGAPWDRLHGIGSGCGHLILFQLHRDHRQCVQGRHPASLTNPGSLHFGESDPNGVAAHFAAVVSGGGELALALLTTRKPVSIMCRSMMLSIAATKEGTEWPALHCPRLGSNTCFGSAAAKARGFVAAVN